MPLTLKDIAKMADVAESTVSRALNNKPGVSDKKRQEIIEIARENNYKPNQLAQGLAKQETHIIALLLSDLQNQSYTEIIKNIEEAANQAGYQIILCNTDNELEKEQSYFELLKRNIVDGAIIVGDRLTDKNILNIALKKEAPIILVNRLSEELLIPTILIDNKHGGYIATEHLIKQGLERIAIVMGPEDNYLESEKLAGYQQALADYNIDQTPELIISGTSNRKQGYNSFLQLMETENPPEGFFTTNNLLAAGLTEAIKMGGYHIPGDFPVISYGDSLISSIINPSLTVVSEPLDELGKIAAKNLINLIHDKSLDNRITVLEPSIKVRDSSIPQFKNKN
ncbi:MAG: LacI family DNA-binding transcriptional regulator [Halanaerobiaceae bacterium]